MAEPYHQNRRSDLFKPLPFCTCVIAVSDAFYLTSLRETLREMKFGNIEVSRDGSQALFLIKKNMFVDVLIAQEDLPIYQCKDIAKTLRSEAFSHHPYLPIICIGWKWTREKIEIYRHIGVDDILVLPASRYTLQRRVLSAVYSERRSAPKRQQQE